MAEINIPEGYNQVMPYLILESPELFFEFTRNVFNAKEKMRHVNEENGLVHGEVIIGESCIMFGGSGDTWQPTTAGLFVYVEDADASYQKAIVAGATVVMELSDRDYGRTCGIKDPCGNTWWITAIKS